MKRSLLTLSLLVLSCGHDDASTDLCQVAAVHLGVCTQQPVEPMAACDEQVAREVLATSCQQLSSPMGKADGWLDTLRCKLGVLRHCPVPPCVGALPEGHDFHGKACERYAELEGCAACDYYRCREAQSQLSCGPDGYLIDFGYRYCMRYALVTEPRMSAYGQSWSIDTRRCLIDEMHALDESQLSCRSLRRASFAAHPRCYQKSGFCSLSFTDKWRLLLTLDPPDYDLRQMLEAVFACL